MHNLRNIFFLFFTVFFISACTIRHAEDTKVVLFTSVPINSKIYIVTIPYFGEKRKVVDSVTIDNNHDAHIMYVPHKVEGLFSLYTGDKKFRFTFVNDSKTVKIHLNYFKKSYSFEGSPASQSLKAFQDSQLVKAAHTRKVFKLIDSLRKADLKNKLANELSKSLNGELIQYNRNYLNYIDTVKSPAAFMLFYNNIEFGNDIKAEKKFILRASARFPAYGPMQILKKEVLATIRIYEEEFNVGDKIPFITLPDTNNKAFSTSSIKNKYYLIDFWSVLSQESIVFKNRERQLATMISPGKLQIVSVALFDKTEDWRKFVSRNHYNWTELIDTKMWQGPAVQTLVFDSIPFNFLVNPEGKIIKKAIKPDSLAPIIAKLNLK